MAEIIQNGISTFEIKDCFKVEEIFLKEFEHNAVKKRNKNYKNTHLIFVVTPHYFKFLTNDEVNDFVGQLMVIIKKIDFKENKVSLLVKKVHINDYQVTSELLNIC